MQCAQIRKLGCGEMRGGRFWFDGTNIFYIDANRLPLGHCQYGNSPGMAQVEVE